MEVVAGERGMQTKESVCTERVRGSVKLNSCFPSPS